MEGKMFLETIRHVAIIVSDYNLSRDFYVNKLGLKSYVKITVRNVTIINQIYVVVIQNWKSLEIRLVIQPMWSHQSVCLILRRVDYVIQLLKWLILKRLSSLWNKKVFHANLFARTVLLGKRWLSLLIQTGSLWNYMSSFFDPIF